MNAVPAGGSSSLASFRDLALSEPVLRAVADVGYEAPSPIQAATIPVLLSGVDMLGQAQTGTGKTAAFALPALSRIDLAGYDPQVLVLVPTRELALQVAEAFLRYAAHLKGFHVLPIYGGQSYQPQLNALKRGVHVVVGTPGRVIDHMNRGTLKLANLNLVVLDEADEMLRMGFIDAVESILEQTPPQRQVALFSATLPAPIRRIAQKHLRSPVEVTIKTTTSSAANIRQRYWVVSGMHKLDALTRILETEPFEGMLVFTRTKQSTVELAEKLEARGFSAAPLNGDIPQHLRERTVARLKAAEIDIVVATDVAARGLDVERIGHVVNYDLPNDIESYVHRIGRTGRAGRKGEAILFIAPRERNLLRTIEHATRQSIEPMNLPTVDAVNAARIAKFKARVTETIEKGGAETFRPILLELETETGLPLIDIAAALAALGQGSAPLLLPEKTAAAPPPRVEAPRAEPPRGEPRRPDEPRRAPKRPSDAPRATFPRSDTPSPPPAPVRREPAAERAVPRREPAARLGVERLGVERPGVERLGVERRGVERPGVEPPGVERTAAPRETFVRGMRETFRIEVGSLQGIKPGQVVGAIANEAGIEGVHIGRVDIREDHSYVDLPAGMPKQVFKHLQKVRVAGRELKISKVDEKPPKPPRSPIGRHVGRKPAAGRRDTKF